MLAIETVYHKIGKGGRRCGVTRGALQSRTLTPRRVRQRAILWSKVSPNYGEASKEHIRTALISRHLGGEWIPGALSSRLAPTVLVSERTRRQFPASMEPERA